MTLNEFKSYFTFYDGVVSECSGFQKETLNHDYCFSTKGSKCWIVGEVESCELNVYYTHEPRGLSGHVTVDAHTNISGSYYGYDDISQSVIDEIMKDYSVAEQSVVQLSLF